MDSGTRNLEFPKGGDKWVEDNDNVPGFQDFQDDMFAGDCYQR